MCIKGACMEGIEVLPTYSDLDSILSASSHEAWQSCAAEEAEARSGRAVRVQPRVLHKRSQLTAC